MKKILYISSNDPEYFNGGAIGTKKIIEALKELENEGKIEWYAVVSKEKQNNNSKKYYLEIQRNKIKAYLSRMLGYAEQMELNIKSIINTIKQKEIEIVILQNSRLGNISEKIKKCFPKVKIIQNFDNFEYEFSKMFTKNMNIVVKIIEVYNVKKSEKKAVESMDLGIFLTEKDRKGVENFYNKKIQNYEIVPIIYDNIFNRKKIIEKKNQAIFTGSLDMEANIEAGLFLIENYRQIFEKAELKLILAGRNPSKKLNDKIKELKLELQIEIIANPTKEKMENSLRESLIYISPIFEGSGMKTKLLEALFYGVPIIASEHTVIGYNNLDKQYIKIFKDKNINEIKEFINEFLEKFKKVEVYTEEKIREYYFENFSIKNSTKELNKIIEKI